MAGFNMDGYVDVAERIRIFRDSYPEGSLQPLNPDRPFEVVAIEGKQFIVCVEAAYRTPDDPRPGVGTAWEPVPGKTQFTKDSELMNAQTGAWGRAIVAALAADTKRGIATAQDVRNRQESKPSHPETLALAEEKGRVWKAAQALDMDADDMRADFSATHDGADITAAALSELTAYAEQLEALKQPELGAA